MREGNGWVGSGLIFFHFRYFQDIGSIFIFFTMIG